MGIFNWVINFVPVISTVVGWVRKLFNVKFVAFLALKGMLFYLFYKFLPVLFGSFFQWIYNLSADSVDLSYLSSVLLSPHLTGFPAWLWDNLQLNTCLRIVITGATIRLGLKKIPFMS